MSERSQCGKYPWRDMATMESEFPEIVEYGKANLDAFVCHTRMGACSGPRRSLLVGVA